MAYQAINPILGMTYKRAMRIERIARLSLDPANYTIAQIANLIGINHNTVAAIRGLPAYHAKLMELSTGVLSSYDAELRANVDNMREEMRMMVPNSMSVIRDSLLGKYGPGIRFKAATEVLDREGTLAKVSKSSVQVQTVPNMELNPEIASNLMGLLANAPNLAPGDITVNTFTVSAKAAGLQQAQMVEDNTAATLEALDLSDKKPN